jgi:hypothetical protein
VVHALVTKPAIVGLVVRVAALRELVVVGLFQNVDQCAGFDIPAYKDQNTFVRIVGKLCQTLHVIARSYRATELAYSYNLPRIFLDD